MLRAIYSRVFLEHKPMQRHPENPARLNSVVAGLVKAGVPIIEEFDVDESLPYLAHEREYVEFIRSLRGYTNIDSDTYFSSDSYKAAIHAVSAAVYAVKAALREGTSFYVAVRPPGHHAGRRGRALGAPSQGFCIFNNAAIAALTGGEKTAVIDVDVHHGNGTQEILYEKDILYISTHQDPYTLYPGTGRIDEVGAGAGEGYNINIPLPPYSGDDIYVEVVNRIIVPILKQYGPRLVVVSLGWDAHTSDPLAELELTVNSYIYLIERLMALGVPIVYVLEGGYSYNVLENGTFSLAMLYRGEKVRLEQWSETDPHVASRARKVIREVIKTHAQFWDLSS